MKYIESNTKGNEKGFFIVREDWRVGDIPFAIFIIVLSPLFIEICLCGFCPLLSNFEHPLSNRKAFNVSSWLSLLVGFYFHPRARILVSQPLILQGSFPIFPFILVCALLISSHHLCFPRLG